MMKKIIAIGIIFLLAASSMVGCGENGNFLGGNTEVKTDTVTTTEIYIPVEKIRTLNPVITKDEDAYYINKLIYEGLFEFDETLALNHVLAESYSYDQGGNAVSIKLKKGVKWHDGHDFTAEDVKFSIESYLSAANSGLSIYSKNVSNIKNVKIESSDQVLVTFISNANITMENFTFPIIPKHKFKNVESVKLANEGFTPVGTGPYMVSEYNDLTHITLMGNKAYHSGNPPKNAMNFQIMPDKLDAVNLMDVNNISLIFSKEIDRDTIYTNKNVNMVSFPSNEVELVGFNFKSSFMKDKKIRQAVACAIDINKILETGYFQNGLPNDTIYYPNYLGIQSKQSQYQFDITRSKKLLVEAGYIDRDGDGISENIYNDKITINILVNAEDQSRIAAAEIIKNGLDKLSVESNITYKDWAEYNNELSKGNFDIFIGGFQINETYDMRPFLHTNYANMIGYSNVKLDALLDKMESGLSNDEKKNTFSQVKEILSEDLPYYCLLYKTYGAIASPALHGELKPYFHNLYNGSENWSCVHEKPASVTE